MKKAEAEELIGRKVEAWTALNGTYVGTFVEVVPRRPWRGKVKITGVLKAACVWQIGRPRPRRGFRPGEVIEVGGVNIKPTELEGGTYLASLEAELEFSRQTLENPQVLDKFKFGLTPTIRNLEECIAREKQALIAADGEAAPAGGAGTPPAGGGCGFDKNDCLCLMSEPEDESPFCAKCGKSDQPCDCVPLPCSCGGDLRVCGCDNPADKY